MSIPSQRYATEGKKRGFFPLIITSVNIVGSLLILALMVLVGLDVAGRNLLGEPLSGVPEIVTLSIVVIVFLQAPAALAAGRLTRSDTLIKWLATRSPSSAKVLETFFDLCGLVVFGVIAYGTWPLLTKSWRTDEFIGALGDFTAPVWPVRAAVILGSVLLTTQFVIRLFERWRSNHDTI